MDQTTFLGLVFLYAALARAADTHAMRQEASHFRMPHQVGWLVVATELALAYCVLTNTYKKQALQAAALFLGGATLLMIALNGKKIVTTAHEISTYQPTAMSLVLHVTYLVMIIHALTTSE